MATLLTDSPVWQDQRRPKAVLESQGDWRVGLQAFAGTRRQFREPIVRRKNEPHVRPFLEVAVRGDIGWRVRPDVGTRTYFAELAARWKRETSHLSTVAEMVLHPAYQQIIGIGRDAIPLVLVELAHSTDHWFWALRMVSRADPVPDSARGNVPAMADAWLEWGRKQGYIE